jgi:SAM-dependent methyltransferase
VGDEVLDRLRDRLPVNLPYEGLVAEAYDAWIGVDDVFPDDVVYEALLSEVDGPVLELGCGTGRPLLRWLSAGHEVEGIDASADMLSILHRNAAARSLDPVLHLGDIAPLELGRSYAALVCPAGTFTLVDDEVRVVDALRSYHSHLRPGGRLGLTLHRLEPTARDSLRWRIRRTGTVADGTTVVVHEALHLPEGGRVQEVYNRLETYGDDGRLTSTVLRRLRLRSWEQEEIEVLLGEAGFVEISHRGGAEGWVTLARRPG